MVAAVKRCLTERYFDFHGRASRSEFWWFTLLTTIVYAVARAVLDSGAYHYATGYERLGMYVLAAVCILLFSPSVAVQVRRLHDVGRSGWWFFLNAVPLLDLVLLYWFVKKSQPGLNRYGPQPPETL